MIHLAEDTIDKKDIDRLISWLKTYPRLTQGSVVKEFEMKWGKWLGRPYSTFCNSGSSANLLMYQTLLSSGLLGNKLVIVPATSWATSVMPAIQLGFKPIMCETDPRTFGLNLPYLEYLLETYKPSTVFLVQVLGVPNNMKQIMSLKKKYKFILLEDACAAVGSETYLKVGTFGDMSSFSFYFGHQISTIEGGMVSTNNKDFHDLLVMIRSHGWDKDLVKDPYHPFTFCEPGFNLRSTDLNAFIGIGQLKKLNRIRMKRHRNHMLYKKLLKRFYTQDCSDGLISSIHFALITYTPEQRNRIVKALRANEIETRLFTAGNIGMHPFWLNRYGFNQYPVADRIYNCGLFLPNHPSLTTKDIKRIAQVVLSA